LALRGDFQSGEVTLGSRADPKGYSSLLRVDLQIVYDQSRLLAPMDVQPRFAIVDFDPVSCPRARLQVDIRFVLFGRFLAQAGKIELRI
jgi:hypothetical protein